MSDSMRALVLDALRTVATEAPAADDELRRAIGDRSLRIDVGAESFSLAFGCAAAPDPPHVEIATSARALHDVVTGERALHDAVIADAIAVSGSPDALIAGADAASLFFKGVVRCRSADELLRRLERLADLEGA